MEYTAERNPARRARGGLGGRDRPPLDASEINLGEIPVLITR